MVLGNLCRLAGVRPPKPYAAGGAYIDRMSDYCAGCAYDRKLRTGTDACPAATLYWDFLARHAERFARNRRVEGAQPPVELVVQHPDRHHVAHRHHHSLPRPMVP
jgi:deoxyribodipyrimidine photolyase-like uncharacterized protein